jgi:hypothetical protein
MLHYMLKFVVQPCVRTGTGCACRNLEWNVHILLFGRLLRLDWRRSAEFHLTKNWINFFTCRYQIRVGLMFDRWHVSWAHGPSASFSSLRLSARTASLLFMIKAAPSPSSCPWSKQHYHHQPAVGPSPPLEASMSVDAIVPDNPNSITTAHWHGATAVVWGRKGSHQVNYFFTQYGTTQTRVEILSLHRWVKLEWLQLIFNYGFTDGLIRSTVTVPI